MTFEVIGYSKEILGQVDASDIRDAWLKARKQYSNVLDVRKLELPLMSGREADFPLEAREDITFCKHMFDLEKTANRHLDNEEIAERWEKWKALRYRPKTEEERRLVHKTKYGNNELPPRGQRR